MSFIDNPQVQAVKERILNKALLAFAILSIPTLGASLFRMVHMGWTNLFLFQVLIVILLWGLYLGRNALSFTAKIAIIIIIGSVLGLYGALKLGLAGGWEVILVIPPVILTVFYGKRQGIMLLGVLSIILLVIAIAHISRWVEADPGIINFNESVYFWSSSILTLAFLISPLLFMIGQSRYHMEHNVMKLQDKTKELESTKEDLSQTLDFLPIPIRISDNEGKIIQINQKFIDTFGYMLSEIPDIDVWSYKVFPDDKYRQKSVDMWTSDVSYSKRIEEDAAPRIYSMTTKDGRLLQMELSIKVFGNKVMTGFSDLTQRIENEKKLRDKEEVLRQKNTEYMRLNQELLGRNKEIEQINDNLAIAKNAAEESERMKTAFLQNMSHEIRTPLNGIIGFADMMTDPTLPDELQSAYSSIIIKSGEQLLSIVNDIINLAEIESGRTVTETETVDVNTTISEIITFFQPKAKIINVSLIAKTPADQQNIQIKTKKSKFKQILINLVGNSLKFTHKGYVEIGYVVQHDHVLVHVKDTGIGIKRSLHRKIFERFDQGDPDVAKKYGGAGLGLSISKSFVEILGGTIWVESEVGMGTTFYFTHPLPSDFHKN